MGWRDELEALSAVLFPSVCVGCDRPLAARPPFGLCGPCWEVSEPNLGPRCPICDLPNQQGTCSICRQRPPPFARLRAPFVYGGTIADLVRAAKLRAREDLARAMGELVAADAEARALAADADRVVSVPLGPKRGRQRGYNQAAVMAREIGRAWKVAWGFWLRRSRETRPQMELIRAERRDNVADAFVARGAISGRVVLVDDVVTSGETVRAASQALREAGATQVVVVALARAILD